MINESSFPVTDIYLTLTNINFIFSILKLRNRFRKKYPKRHDMLNQSKPLQLRSWEKSNYIAISMPTNYQLTSIPIETSFIEKTFSALHSAILSDWQIDK